MSIQTIPNFFVAKDTNPSNCNDRDLRINGSVREGRVEVCYNQAWGTICGRSSYGTDAAGILCLEMGFRRKCIHT